MKVRVKFLGIPGINVSEIEVEVEEPEVRYVMENICRIFPGVFSTPSSTLQRFLILIENERGKTTNIRLKNGINTFIKKGEAIVIMPPLTGGKIRDVRDRRIYSGAVEGRS